jgi:hypothetical protein
VEKLLAARQILDEWTGLRQVSPALARKLGLEKSDVRNTRKADAQIVGKTVRERL